MGTVLYNSEMFRLFQHEGKELTKEELLKEDTFNLGVSLLQFVCSFTEQELLCVRVGTSGEQEGRMKICEELDEAIPSARQKNFDKFAGALIEHLNPHFP